jgi:N-acetyl-gamma-glutamyl-phosphate reductase common form
MKVALVGGRGYTGAEFLRLLAAHPQMELAFASSSSQAGLPISAACPGWPNPDDCFENVQADDLKGREADAWVLAVPNGVAARWAAAIAEVNPQAVVLDLSADHRFDSAWAYGLPEHNRAELAGARRIANPGCYATAAQLALWPLREQLEGVPVVFGVSGYSGAGKTPSPKNDPARLAENLLPYALSGHMHEREVAHRLQRSVHFMPHVASFFRGISVTVSARLRQPTSVAALLESFSEAYAGEPRLRVSSDIPEVVMVRDTPNAAIGGFAVAAHDPCQLAVVCVLDNLAKGAASQAMQNLNLALGLAEHTGVDT